LPPLRKGENYKIPLAPFKKGGNYKIPLNPRFQRGRKLLFHTSLKMQEGYHINVTFQNSNN